MKATATSIEYMVVAASREIVNGQLLMVGTQWPMLAAMLAKRNHAPDCVMAFEGGIIYDQLPPRTPLITVDPGYLSNALFCGGTLDVMGALLHGGRVDLAFIPAASVDRYGNVNTTYRFDDSGRRIRLSGGSGGACDFASLASKLIIIMEHDKKRFQEKLKYITSPGYLDGYDSRLKAGLRPGTGPWAMYTTLGRFKFDSETKEMYLDGHYQGVTVEQVKENTGWDLKVSPTVEEIAPPTAEEIRIIREEIDPLGMWRDNLRLKWRSPTP